MCIMICLYEITLYLIIYYTYIEILNKLHKYEIKLYLDEDRIDYAL